MGIIVFIDAKDLLTLILPYTLRTLTF